MQERHKPHFPLLSLSRGFGNEKSVKRLIGKYDRLVVYTRPSLYTSRLVAVYPQIQCLELAREGQEFLKESGKTLN